MKKKKNNKHKQSKHILVFAISNDQIPYTENNHKFITHDNQL